MIKSSYPEGMYYKDSLHVASGEVEAEIRMLLSENHGVGILGGYYRTGFPICMVSELTLTMLGYASAAEFEEATGGCLQNLAYSNEYTADAFAMPDGTYELYLRGKTGRIWVRMVKHDVTLPNGERLWLASVCDMDALYQKNLQMDRMLLEKKQQKLLHQLELEQANKELEQQKYVLEQALDVAEKDNEVISAIGSIYRLIYLLDLKEGSFEEIVINGVQQRASDDRGLIAERFPEACRRTTAPAYLSIMLRFLDDRTLADRLQHRDSIAQEYQTVSGNWNRGCFIVQMRDAGGRAVRVLYAIQVITEQKRRELEFEQRLAKSAEEARRANLTKTDFLRRMSHDIRTPLNGIRGMIEIANHYADDPQKQKECREKIWRASGYLLSLVNSVLDMNKLESGAVILANEPFDLLQLLEEVRIVAEMQATERGLHFRIDRKKDHFTHRALIGSPTHLKQVLLNLAGNAVKYNRENGSITVYCEELTANETTAVFRFVCADTGIGMSREFQTHAFEPFSQEGKSTHSHYDGSGLGLSIVKGLVEQMGGSIDFESEENVGTTFRVTLNFRIDPEPKPAKEISATDTAVDFTGRKILLVEDNDLNQEIAQFILEQHGIRVELAENGRAAVDRFAASAPGEFDLILMDIMMPVMGGYAATQRIRAMERPDAATVPIIAMSANAFQDDMQKSRAVGMNDHLAKPLSADRLIAALKAYLQ